MTEDEIGREAYDRLMCIVAAERQRLAAERQRAEFLDRCRASCVPEDLASEWWEEMVERAHRGGGSQES